MQNLRNQNTQPNPTRLEQAKWLAEKGLVIFECEANSKRPIAGHSWYTRQTTDPEVIAGWFEDSPDMNYGVHPGEEYVVIDLDLGVNKNGLTEWELLQLEHGAASETFTVKTPSGGRHLYFRTPFPVANANDLPSGIDVRGAVGYVIGPGSRFEGNDYSIINDVEIAEAPQWLLDDYLIEPGFKRENHNVPLCEWDLPENVQLAVNFLADQKPAVEGEEGDLHTFNTCQWLRDFGISESKSLELLQLSGWNEKCEPPWSPEELEVKITNAYRYAENRPGCRRNKLIGLRLIQNPNLDFTVTDGVNLSKSQLALVVDNSRPSKTETQPERFWYDANDFECRGRRREYVIPEWLPAHGLTALLANRGVGKSTILLDLALRAACDMNWHGLPLMKDFKVVYLCGEDDEGLEVNLNAWTTKHERKPERGRLRIADGIIKLQSEEDVAKRAQEIKDWVGDSRAIIILDTWQRATTGLKANAQEEMDVAVERAEIIAELVNGPIIGAFHPPKDGRVTIMGSSVMENTTSAIWNLEKSIEENTVKLKVVRIKGKGHGNYRKFYFEETNIGSQDTHGTEESGIVPVYRGGTEDTSKAAALEKSREQRVIATVVREIFVANATSLMSLAGVSNILAESEFDGGIKFPKLRQTTDILKRNFSNIPFIFEDGSILTLTKNGRNWHLALEPENSSAKSAIVGNRR